MRRTNHKESYSDRDKMHSFNVAHDANVHINADRLKMKAYCQMVLANIPQYVASLVSHNSYTERHPLTQDAYNAIERIKPFSSPCVYFLYDPRTEKIAYIGCTDNPKRRKWQHTKQINTGSKAYMYWRRELDDIGLVPIFKIYKPYSDMDLARICERELIIEFKEQGKPILNKLI